MPFIPAKLKTITHILLGLSLGICLGLVGGVWIGRMTMLNETKNLPENQTPIRVVTITLNESQQNELFDQITKFADKWAYAVRVAPAEASEKYFGVDLWRSDLKVLGLYGEGQLDLAFSYTDSAHPVPDEYIEKEIDDLESFISEIPGVTFSVK